MKQLRLIPNDIKKTYKKEDYVLSDSNNISYKKLMIDDWNFHCSIIFGIKGSGKTHLAHLWHDKTNAIFIHPEQYNTLMTHSCIIEDFDINLKEKELFHCFNIAKEYGNKLLLTSSVHVNQLSLDLPDLRTRFFIANHIELFPPDENILRIMLVKGFYEKNMRVKSYVIDYLLNNIERSADSVIRVINIICDVAHRTGKDVNLHLIRNVLSDYII